MNLKFIFLFVFFVTVCFASKPNDSAILDANKFVKGIDENIKIGKYSQLVIEEFSTYEGSPAKITFFFIKDSIMIAAKVSVGHEIWVNQFYYYYNEDGYIIKYLKKAIDNPYNPKNEAIIFDGNEKIIWKNIDEMVVPANRIKELFTSIQKIRLDFARY